MNMLPRDLLVFLYKHTPFVGLKNWIVYRAQHKFLVAVLGIFTNEAGQILLLNHVYRKEPWGIPGGWMELEKPEDGLKREVLEETGLEIQIDGIAKALYNRNPNRVDLIFTGKVIGGTFKPCSEISQICFCNMNEWPAGMPVSQQKLIKEILIK
ncbi:NUDIX hydrolase [Paenibacillus castaneae]|nr:NUDIX hydrolase [Paenibacillus castaneae]